MPRRLRLDFVEEVGACDLCGETVNKLVRRYRTKNYGVNYTGVWLHPLSPYNYDPKGEKPPLSVKGQTTRGGIGYRHWLGLTLGNEEKMPDAALVVKHFMQQQERLPEAARRMQLWCFGYDMDNMKARCWYDNTLPIYSIADEKQRELFAEAVEKLLDVATETAKALHQYVKLAWFNRPSDHGNEPAVPQSLWQHSETEFYRTLQALVAADLTRNEVLIPIYCVWLRSVEHTAVELFDEWVLTAPIEEMNMKRVIGARVGLLHQLRTKGAAKQLWIAIKEFKGVKS
jgi:CRISPR system Cascade subunit CasA